LRPDRRRVRARRRSLFVVVGKKGRRRYDERRRAVFAVAVVGLCRHHPVGLGNLTGELVDPADEQHQHGHDGGQQGGAHGNEVVVTRHGSGQIVLVTIVLVTMVALGDTLALSGPRRDLLATSEDPRCVRPTLTRPV